MWTICRSYANHILNICILYVDRMLLICESYANYMWILISSSSIFLNFLPFFMWHTFSLNCFMKSIGLIDKNLLWSTPPLPTVKTVFEVSMIYIIFAYSSHMIRILLTYDPHSIRIWSAYDSHTIMCKYYVICILFTYFYM